MVSDIHAVVGPEDVPFCYASVTKADGVFSRGGHIVVWANGWVQDSSLKKTVGFWIHDISHDGDEIELYLAGSGIWEHPLGFDSPPSYYTDRDSYTYVLRKKEAKKLARFWQNKPDLVSGRHVDFTEEEDYWQLTENTAVR